MTHPNLDLINQFFAAYGQHDLDALRQVLAEDVRWIFPGCHSLWVPGIRMAQLLCSAL